MKKILIFYSETGGGHLSGAQALAEEIGLRGNYKVALYDGLKKTNWGQKTNPSLVFSLILHGLLPVYNLVYKSTDERYGVKVLRSVIKSIWGINFIRIIREEQPDLVVTTHHFISPSTMARMDQRPPFVIVVVDLGKPHRIWFDTRADKIIVPDPTMVSWAKDKFKIASSKIISLGFPLKSSFKKVKQEGRTQQILILGAGIKPKFVKRWIKEISSSSRKIVIICGHNRILLKSLSKIEGVKLYGFINNLHDILAQSDLVVTKAGPGSILEAAAFRKPLVIVKWVGMQERDNVDFVVDNNLGIYDPDGKNLNATISKIYENYKDFSNQIVSFSTDKIVDYLLTLT